MAGEAEVKTTTKEGVGAEKGTREMIDGKDGEEVGKKLQIQNIGGDTNKNDKMIKGDANVQVDG